jgi:molybdopterin molybdotransferase/putative molybdopterin biosynthesis protein
MTQPADRSAGGPDAHAGGGVRPVPQAAYERWLDSLVRADWSPRPGPGEPDDDAADLDTAGDRHRERVAVGDALGRVTAAEVAARWPSPRTDCAAMDGIAVRAADLPAAPADRQAVQRLPAGRFEWIDTGDPMPPGADTVIVRERLLPQADGSVIITAETGDGPGGGRRPGHSRGRNVRAAGEDFAAGEILVPAGRWLRPGDLAAVAAGGHVTVTVTRQPVVAIIPTGDEIRPVGTVPRFGDITDTNSLMLAARCRQLGAVPVVSAIVPDDPDALAVELRHAAGRADLVLVIAGSSRGRGDHAGAVLDQVGGVAVAGVAVRPGHPALLGHAKRPDASQGGPANPALPKNHTVPANPIVRDDRSGIAPVIGLPGYPLATAVIFELFAAPVLSMFTGRTLVRDRVRARLDRDWASPSGVEDWVLVTLTADRAGGVPLATPARRGAGSISQLARADAWWPIPADRDAFTAGAEIEVIRVPGGTGGA